jgi:16S rRNA processing protein RimM
MDAPAGEGRITVGLVRGLHGLRGTVRVEVLTDDPNRFAPGSVLTVADSGRHLTIAETRSDRPPGLLVSFREVRDRSAAQALRDAYLEAEAPPRADGTWFWHEVVGCAVTTTDGRQLGQVEDVFRVGESEVYVVRSEEGEVLIPAVKSVIRELAPAERRIVVDAAALGLKDD